MTGIWGLVRLCIRRDRIVAPLWILVVGLVPLLYAVSFEGLYPTAADRQVFYEATLRAPAELAMVGPIFGSDLGALVTWRAGLLLTLTPLAAILTVIRHSRAEEDAGRTELMGSTAVGRHAGLAAALLVAVGAVSATGVIAAVSLVATGFAVAGSVAFGLAIGMSGAVFAGVAAVAAQIGSSARLARGYSLSVLAAAFALRAVGDAGSGTLSWFSPIGWAAQIRPFAGERWWVAAPLLVAAASTIAVSFALAGARDLGGGLVADRLGPAGASPGGVFSLSGVFSLAWRQQRGPLIAWTVGLGLFGLVLGSAADGVSGQLGESQAITDALARFGGTSSITASFVATVIGILGIGAAAYAISAVLRAHTEEESLRAESILAGSVGRIRWLSTHLLYALVGSAVAMLVVGFATGITYGLGVGDLGSVLPGVLGGALSQLPAVWVLAGVTVLLFGAIPRWTSAAWAVLAACVLLGQVGTVIGLPQPVLDLSPFTHLPHLPGGQVSVTSLVWLTAVALVALTAGTSMFRQRDLRG
ncbi:ABC transporter permease [Rhodococcoides yunnanense]|uniref:ABC transporter permease n=1 Tax=Rhodococcoides yunnanense TaxID=278209 RepID=UPI00093454BA|nr:ABC transporter permease [Rhodococcus yunnanensis]